MANGGAGAQANGGKGGKSGASPGGRAGSGDVADAGSGDLAGGGSVGTAGADATAGAGPEAGSGGEAPVDPCAACAPGLCLPDGTCAECLPSNDVCPAGKYCSAVNTCVDGCKNGDSCASGVCDANHDCQSCTSDLECAEPHVCGAGQCAAACSAEQQGGNLGCGTGLTCCSLHCVATLNDQQNCGACGTACTASQFCGQSGCVPNQVSSICNVGKLVVILDGQTGDDPTGRALAQALVTRCASPPTVREVSQTVLDVLNPVNGRPISGSDELLVVAGSGFFQQSIAYLGTINVAVIDPKGTQTSYEMRKMSTGTTPGALIASQLISAATTSHDLFTVQFMREPSSGSLILSAYGFVSSGTAAATFYAGQVLAANLATATKSWYVGEWTDKDADLAPDADEITIINSGI